MVRPTDSENNLDNRIEKLEETEPKYSERHDRPIFPPQALRKTHLLITHRNMSNQFHANENDNNVTNTRVIRTLEKKWLLNNAQHLLIQNSGFFHNISQK